MDADAAFVGRVVTRDDSSGLTLIFEVETAVKGQVGDRVEVVSEPSSCGLWMAEGERSGLFLRRDETGNLHGSLCSTIDPDVLLRAAEPLPAPDGSVPPRFFIGGRIGETRLWVLDGAGKTLAYGFGKGPTAEVAVCPGGGRAVEVYGEINSPRIGVRDLQTFELSSEEELWEPARVSGGTSYENLRSLGLRSNGIEAMACLAPEGDDAVYIAEAPVLGALKVVVRVRPEGSTLLWKGVTDTASIAPDSRIAYIATDDPLGTDRAIMALDLDTAEAAYMASISATAEEKIRSLAIDPDGQRVAAVLPKPNNRGAVRLVVVDTTVEPSAVAEIALDEDTGHTRVLWVDRDRLLVLPNNGRAGPLVLDRSLNRLASLPVVDSFSNPVILDHTLYALVFRPPAGHVLVALDIETGTLSQLREFDLGDVWTFVGVGDDSIDTANFGALARATAIDAGGEVGRRPVADNWAAIAGGGIAATVLVGGAWLAIRRRRGGAVS